MRIRYLLCAAIALPPLALAEIAVSGDSLGTAQGMVDFCAQLNPAAAAKLKDQAGQLVRGVPEREVAKLRRTAAYQEAYQSVSAELDQVPAQEALVACNGFLQGDGSGEGN